jgi:hypothetical protein
MEPFAHILSPPGVGIPLTATVVIVVLDVPEFHDGFFFSLIADLVSEFYFFHDAHSCPIPILFLFRCVCVKRVAETFSNMGAIARKKTGPGIFVTLFGRMGGVAISAMDPMFGIVLPIRCFVVFLCQRQPNYLYLLNI